MATYSINFINDSNSSGNFCIFQQNPGSPNPGVLPLAWLVQFVNPHSRVLLSWNTDIYFFWAQTGALMPGVLFNAGEALPAGMTENNSVTLTRHDSNYKFTDQKNGHQQGILSVTSDNTTAMNQASVGIGMSGSGTFAVQAQPNMTFLFSPDPEYWIIFGDFKQGEVMNPSDISKAAPIVFPPGIFSVNATLNMNNTWTITEGQD